MYMGADVEQLKNEIDELKEKRRKAASEVKDLLLWDNIVHLAKVRTCAVQCAFGLTLTGAATSQKAAPFCSLGFFLMLICIVFNQ